MANVANNAKQRLELKDMLRNVLEEARMILPGIQALFGFQLIAAFNVTFQKIPVCDKYLHFAALLLTIFAIGALMGPASYHRQVERHSVSEEFIDYSSQLLCLGMFPLALSITLDTYVVSHMMTDGIIPALSAALLTFITLMTFWYFIPQTKKRMERLSPADKSNNNHQVNLY